MIAYESNNDLCFDTEAFRSAAKVYREKAQTLNDIKSDLIAMIDQLQSVGWKSAAGRAFLNNLQSNWGDDIRRYADLMDMLADCIDQASASFENLRTEAEALKIDSSPF